MEAAGAGDHEAGHGNGGVLAAEAGNGGDDAGRDPLNETEDGGSAAGVVGDGGGGEGSRSPRKTTSTSAGHQSAALVRPRRGGRSFAADETRGERMSHALVRPGCGTSSRARWSGSLVQPRLQFHATRSSTASTVDQRRRGGRRRREPKWSRPVLTKLTSRDGGCGRSLVIER
jgi:hypothetical protein